MSDVMPEVMPGRVLVFGATGQVARELALLMPEARFLSRENADLSDPETCAAAIRHHAPDAVINAAAYTAVDRAEEEGDLARLINAAAPTAMAQAAARRGCPFVHISTDYVFDGRGRVPWRPGDETGPQGAYGRSKLEGEQGVADSAAAFVILRTSWVFSSFGDNFLKTMLRLSETRDHLSIVDDQTGGPTPASGVAKTCLTLARQLREAPEKTGIYHYSGAPDTSWKGFAEAIFQAAGRNISVTGIPTVDFPTPAKRPLNSRLDCDATQSVFGVARPDWRAATVDIVTQLLRRQGAK